MNKFIVPLFSLILAIGVLFAPSVALAQAGNSKAVQDGLTNIKGSFPTTKIDGEPENLVKTVIEWALYIGAMLAVIFIIIGGYKYITSAGSDDQAKSGRKTISYAVIGLVIIVFSWIIVQTVYNFITKPS